MAISKKSTAVKAKTGKRLIKKGKASKSKILLVLGLLFSVIVLSVGITIFYGYRVSLGTADEIVSIDFLPLTGSGDSQNQASAQCIVYDFNSRISSTRSCVALGSSGWYESTNGDRSFYYCKNTSTNTASGCINAKQMNQYCEVTNNGQTFITTCQHNAIGTTSYTATTGDITNYVCEKENYPLATGCNNIEGKPNLSTADSLAILSCNGIDSKNLGKCYQLGNSNWYEATQGDIIYYYCDSNNGINAMNCIDSRYLKNYCAEKVNNNASYQACTHLDPYGTLYRSETGTTYACQKNGFPFVTNCGNYTTPTLTPSKSK